MGRLLASLHPETEELAPLAAHMIVRLLNAGHDDVAYNLVQFLAENSAEESSRLVSAEFLEQLVRTNATVTKLLWFLKVCNVNYCTVLAALLIRIRNYLTRSHPDPDPTLLTKKYA